MLNKTTYDALPYTYIGSGLMIAVALDSQLRFVPAVMLTIAGLLVLAWRRSARQRAQRLAVAKAGTRRHYPEHLTPWLG